jgi:hypothetical protein
MTLVQESRPSIADAGATPSERRRGLRIRQARPIKIYEPTVARYFGGQTEDISATGLRIELPLMAPIRAGRLLNVHVGMDDDARSLANRRSMIPARVVWVDRSSTPRSSRQIAGLEFLASLAAELHAA